MARAGLAMGSPTIRGSFLEEFLSWGVHAELKLFEMFGPGFRVLVWGLGIRDSIRRSGCEGVL